MPTLSRMIEELLPSEGIRLVDIEFLNSGGSSSVFQIGDKVIKIGKPRKTYNIPNHPRILQPLTRINLLREDSLDTPFACIEIAERVDRLGDDDISYEEMYQIYKELRDDGIIWTDIRVENLGRLRKDNVNILNGEEIDVAPNSVGFTNGKNKKVLKKGDIVIIDTDLLYTQDCKEIYWPNLFLYNRFERRWQQERQAEIAKQYNAEGAQQERVQNEEQIEDDRGKAG